MVAGFEWLSPTRAVGLVAYSVSLAACAAGYTRRGPAGRAFGALAGAQLALLLDMAFDWRWKLHDFWMHEAIAKGVYGERRGPQLLTLEALSVVLALTAVWIVYKLRFRFGLALAATGTAFSASLWFCEAVSYHFVDAVFYRSVGSVMLVSLLWVGLAAVTCLGVWLDLRAGRRWGVCVDRV